SGLGCPDWPRCYGHAYPPVSTHALIEFGNRALSGLVGVVCALVAVASLLRKPFRRDLALLAWSLPLGIVAQAVLGGFTVREDLAPGFVMSHFLLSMVILIFAVALVWQATHEPGWERPRAPDRLVIWSVRVLAVLAAITLVAGTAATAAGPHAGGTGNQDQTIHRLNFKGAGTLEWVVNQHATIAALFGVLVVAVWFLKRSRGHQFEPAEPLTLLGVLLAAQGLVGAVQYELKLPGEMVWVHVGLATITWLVMLWAVAVEGPSAKREHRLQAGA
ncbi:MAG: COX15/CtaA family protein, partial [Solirubrobacterales bacterium]|nr:COX15/CtaA family protein [Solirubrobacterales bacterium]